MRLSITARIPFRNSIRELVKCSRTFSETPKFSRNWSSTSPAQAALVTGGLACLLPRCFLCAHCASFISTVSSRFSSFAPAGTSAAMERGRPM